MIEHNSINYNMNVIVSNFCNCSYGMKAGGGSGVWNNRGKNIALLDSTTAGLAISYNFV